MSKVRANNWANRLDTKSVSHDEVFAMPRVLADYAALRSYTGSATNFKVTTKGVEGDFYVDDADTASTDNNGITVIDGSGRRVKRHFTGSVYPQWFGAVCDGNLHPLSSVFSTIEQAQQVYPFVTSLASELDWAATQAAINYIRTLPVGGKLVFASGSRLVIGTEVDCHPTVPVEIEWQEGSSVHTTLVGAGSVLFKGTNPVTPSVRGKRLVFTNPIIQFHSSVPSSAVGCVFIEHRYASNLKFQGNFGSMLHYRNNTVVRASGLFNCDFAPVSIWGGGVQKAWKINSAARYSIASTTTTLTSDVDVFDASDVGKVLTLQGNSLSQRFTISAYTGPRAVTVTSAAMVTFAGIGGNFETIRGSIELGSTTLTMEKACLDSTDVGRVVYILNARSGFPSPALEPLRATIVAVGSSTSCTLSVAASSTANGTHVIFSPGAEFFGEDDASSNDMVFDGFHTEEMRGTNLVVTRAGNVSMTNLKLHAYNNYYTTSATQFRAVFAGVSGHITGDFEGTCNTALGDVYISGQGGMLTFDKMTGVMANDGCLIYAENNSVGAVINVGDWNINNPSVSTKTLDSAFRIIGSGSLYQKGNIVAYAVNYTRPDVSLRKRVFGKNPPTLAGQVGVASDSSTARLDLIAAGSGNSPVIVGTGYGGNFDSPTDAVDFQTILNIKGMVNVGTNVIDAAGMLFRARAPSGNEASGDISFFTRTGGSFATRWSINTTGGFTPSNDNATPIGSASNRISVLYAGTATINTSDERYKTDVNCINDLVLDAWSEVNYQQYKFIDAVEQKGSEARVHVGLIAQQVQLAFESRGLDAFAFGVLCYDKWDEEAEVVETWAEEIDADGNIVRDAGSLIVSPHKPAGDRYGVRYEEALALEAALMRRTTQRLEARLAALESK